MSGENHAPTSLPRTHWVNLSTDGDAVEKKKIPSIHWDSKTDFSVVQTTFPAFVLFKAHKSVLSCFLKITFLGVFSQPRLRVYVDAESRRLLSSRAFPVPQDSIQIILNNDTCWKKCMIRYCNKSHLI
jgi:hypothetical protein